MELICLCQVAYIENMAGEIFYNLGQNTWDKSQNCPSSVFDYIPPSSHISMLLESNAI